MQSPCGELRGQTALFGEGCRPYLSRSPLPLPLPILSPPLRYKKFQSDLCPDKGKDTSKHALFPACPPARPSTLPGQVPVTRPDSHALDVQYVPLAAHLILPSPCSRSAYLRMIIVAVSHSVPGVHWYRGGCG
jgi:hypothetical protein